MAYVYSEKRSLLRALCATIFEGKVISMSKEVCKPTGEHVRIPRGMIDVLKQRGHYTTSMKVDDMRNELAKHSDFVNEKTSYSQPKARMPLYPQIPLRSKPDRTLLVSG